MSYLMHKSNIINNVDGDDDDDDDDDDEFNTNNKKLKYNCTVRNISKSSLM